ncbi:MAG: heavy metal sensor histidine kinase [Pelomonas sp.]|nr:heavy metal sensor histidine kinase [Roseateles sp.]
MKRPASIAWRLALAFSVAALLGFALSAAMLRTASQNAIERLQALQAHDRIEDLRYLLERGRATDLAQRARDKIETLSRDGRTRYWLWCDTDPAWRYGPDAEALAQRIKGSGDTPDIEEIDGLSMALRAVALPATPVRPPVTLIVGVNREPYRASLARFQARLLLLSVGGALLVAVLGFWGVRWSLRPIARMAAEAQRVGPDNRGQRLQLPALPVELADLGRSFNAAIDRLDAAYAQLETFNADVAHELRTPLATLIGQTQVALSRPRPAAEMEELLHSNLEELERLRTIVADMLFLARAEQGARAERRADASLAAELLKTVEFFDALLEDAGVSVYVEGDARARVEVSLIHRALSNLLHNAIQHAPAGSRIEARVERGEGFVRIALSNPSETIPPEQLARLFDRFYRVDASRPNSDANHGLGLAIVKAVAAMHGGRAFARSERGLTTVGFCVSLE